MKKLLLVLLLLPTLASAQEKPSSPQPKASQMTKEERDAYLARKYGDPLGIDRPATTLREAAKQPLVIAMGVTLFGSAAADAAAQGACAAVHNCAEHNPLMGHSAGQRWGVSMGSTGVLFVCDLWLKKHNHGTTALVLTSLAVTGHTVEAIAGFRDAGVK